MKIFILLLVNFLLTACSINPTGSISVRSVGQDGSLIQPLSTSKELATDKNTIYKTELDGSTNGNDIYAIYLTDAYLKYLADWWGVNEIIFVVEFTEAVIGNKESDTTTKILGPYENLSDGIKAPLLNKVLYGPKKMESDLLTMNIKVYEYDLDESKESSAMLEFIGSAAESFSLSNPVTLGEIKLAKEIANTLLLANENDLVMEMDIDFVAGNAKYIPNNKSNILPLKDGEIVIVKQEGCSVATCYGYFSKNGDKWEGFFPDFLMLPFTFFNRAFTDTPDSKSTEEFKDGGLKVTKKGLTLSSGDKLYQEKTWLRLNIVKGGDASQWLARKALYPSAEEVEKLLRNPYSINKENIDSILKGINGAQQSLLDAKESIKLTSKTSHNGIHFIDIDKSSSDLCISYPNNVKIEGAKLTATDDKLIAKHSDLSDSKGSTCYKLEPNADKDNFGAISNSNSLIVNYSINNKIKVKSIPILSNKKIENEKDFVAKCDSINLPSNSYQITLIDINNKAEQITNINVDNEDLSFSLDGKTILLDRIFTKTGDQKINLKGILGGEATLTIKCIE
ncbi:hypothetical protein C0J08_08720 [Marinomonas sp. CT5]|uniref:hypothetical protein n=1 Tax=Marinomonas sp. CT5 TaxID=2066133 RepID=UPI001BB0145F|nr:hypothetical protein [Marinomonas sp. CT5]QUX95500.1 hypothetical protein C0J08_08720 [Marinomonas sp. CT5]